MGSLVCGQRHLGRCSKERTIADTVAACERHADQAAALGWQQKWRCFRLAGTPTHLVLQLGKLAHHGGRQHIRPARKWQCHREGEVHEDWNLHYRCPLHSLSKIAATLRHPSACPLPPSPRQNTLETSPNGHDLSQFDEGGAQALQVVNSIASQGSLQKRGPLIERGEGQMGPT